MEETNSAAKVSFCWMTLQVMLKFLLHKLLKLAIVSIISICKKNKTKKEAPLNVLIWKKMVK